MEKFLYAVPNSFPKGPYSKEELKELLARGVINHHTLINEQVNEKWQKLWLVLGIPQAEVQPENAK